MFYSKIMFQYLCLCVNFIIKRAAITDCSGLSFDIYIYRYKVIVLYRFRQELNLQNESITFQLKIYLYSVT